jgi:Cu-Zn family superoxide dismutase
LKLSPIWLASTALLLLLPARSGCDTLKAHAIADVVGLDGSSLGHADFSQTNHGVLIEANLHGLPPGPHAMHIDNVGTCDPKKQFASAGSHLSFEPRAHGYFARGGPHEGDLPNQFAAQDGTLRASTISNAFTLGNGTKSLFGPKGGALVLDSAGDDYLTQPSGNSGKRIACGPIKRTIAPGTRRAPSQHAHK